ncbi:MAG: hypothetical protein ACFBSE_27055 [Prochloraceae cyanobacterium]
MTNTNGSERLDRVEQILGRIALRQEAAESHTREIRSIVESNSRTIQGMLEQRATERLEHEQRMRRLESIAERVAKVQEGLSKMLVNLDEDRPTILRKLNTIENKLDRLIEDK